MKINVEHGRALYRTRPVPAHGRPIIVIRDSIPIMDDIFNAGDRPELPASTYHPLGKIKFCVRGTDSPRGNLEIFVIFHMTGDAHTPPCSSGIRLLLTKEDVQCAGGWCWTAAHFDMGIGREVSRALM
jgi:hypothetical protein